MTASATISATLASRLTCEHGNLSISYFEKRVFCKILKGIGYFIVSYHRLTGAESIVVLVKGCAVVNTVEHLVLKLLVVVGQQEGGHAGVFLQDGLRRAGRHRCLHKNLFLNFASKINHFNSRFQTTPRTWDLLYILYLPWLCLSHSGPGCLLSIAFSPKTKLVKVHNEKLSSSTSSTVLCCPVE